MPESSTRPTRRTNHAAALRQKTDPVRRAPAPDYDTHLGLVCGEQLQAYRDAQYIDSLGEQMVEALGLEDDDEMDLAYTVNRDGFWREIARRAAELADPVAYAKLCAANGRKTRGYAALVDVI